MGSGVRVRGGGGGGVGVGGTVVNGRVRKSRVRWLLKCPVSIIRVDLGFETTLVTGVRSRERSLSSPS